MQSPPLEWTLALSHLALLDYLRSRGDADHDTLSEVTRAIVDRVPHGELLFTAGLTLSALWFHRHIVRPLH